jgi:hypothetical protein
MTRCVGTKDEETPPRGASPVESEDPETAQADVYVPLESLLGLKAQREPSVKQEELPSAPLEATGNALVRHSASPSPAPTKSLLEEHPELHWRCKRFLPAAKAELLYQVVGLPRALKRTEWQAFVVANGGRNPEATPSASSLSDCETPHSSRRRGRNRHDVSLSPKRHRRRHKRHRSHSRVISEALYSSASDTPEASPAAQQCRRGLRSGCSRESEYRSSSRNKSEGHEGRHRSPRGDRRPHEVHRSPPLEPAQRTWSERRRKEKLHSNSPKTRAASPGSDRWYAYSEAMEETPEATPESPLPKHNGCALCLSP